MPSPADLERILVEPARRAGYVFDDATLPGEMVRAVAGEPGALALLSFTALRLWELRDRQFKQLRRRSYEAMGSVGGALAAHAEGLLARMTVEEQRLAREAFRHLGTADGLRTVLGTAELAATLGGERGGAVIQALVDGRLLVASEDERGEPTVEVAHEALFTAWPRLAAWRREEAEGARLRDQLRSAARQWQDRGRPRGLLWRDDALAEYRQWRARHPGAVTPLEAQFAGASLAAAARGGRLRMTLIAAAFAVLSVGLLALWRLYGEAERRTAELSAEQGRQALLAGDPVRALEHLDEALRRGLDTPALRYLVARGAKLVAKRRLALLGHGDQLTSGDWAPDGAHLATASRDGGVAVWDARGGERLHTASFGDRAVRVAFDAGGARLVSCGQQAARLSDVATGAVLLAIDPGAAIADCELAVDGSSLLIDLGDAGFGVWDARTGVVRFTVAMPGLHGAMPSLSPDATRVASGGADGVLRIWSIDDGRLTAEQHGHSDRIRRPAWRPDGALIATPSLDGTARVWTAAGEPRAVLRGHAGWIYSAMFSPDGKIVATGSYDQTARLWDAATGELRATLLGHRGPINGLAFSPDGERLATASSDGTARTWDVATGKVLGLCAGHTGALFRIDFSPDGRELPTVSWDATAGVWDAARDDAVAVLRGAAGLYHMGLLRSREVLTAAADGTVTLWSPAGKRVSSHRPPLARPEADVFATDGGRRLVAAEGATAVVWDLVTGAPLARLEGHGHRVSSAAFDARGERLAVGGDDGAIAIYATDGWSRLATLEGHEGSVEALAFDGAGTRLASAGQDLSLIHI